MTSRLPRIPAQTTKRIASQVNHAGRVPQSDVLGWGYFQHEIDKAVAEGRIRRVGCVMGLTTIMYLTTVV